MAARRHPAPAREAHRRPRPARRDGPARREPPHPTPAPPTLRPPYAAHGAGLGRPPAPQRPLALPGDVLPEAHPFALVAEAGGQRPERPAGLAGARIVPRQLLVLGQLAPVRLELGRGQRAGL